MSLGVLHYNAYYNRGQMNKSEEADAYSFFLHNSKPLFLYNKTSALSLHTQITLLHLLGRVCLSTFFLPIYKTYICPESCQGEATLLQPYIETWPSCGALSSQLYTEEIQYNNKSLQTPIV